ncbi:MAG: glycoside hydrolase family 125 protein [Opitutaceae bacterium]
MVKTAVWGCLLFILTVLPSSAARIPAAEFPRRQPLALRADDVVPTGNEWISFPDIRAADGAIGTFNVLSMRMRGLLQVVGGDGAPVIEPRFFADGRALPFQNPSWELIEYWIPTAKLVEDGVEMAVTYCAPPGSHAALIRLTMTNRRSAPVRCSARLFASWGGLDRVTYKPVPLDGERTASPAPWVGPGEAFSYRTDDTQFAWALLYPGGHGTPTDQPVTEAPAVWAKHDAVLAPGRTLEADFILGVGVEEFSAASAAAVLQERIDRHGADGVIARAAAWLHRREHTTGRADLDLLMNRNAFFTAFYAWGKTIDTEQTVGVTSRSPRYYVSAAYWDRDAMLWSFPALLDIDSGLAREALEYALGPQLRNTGTHSRFIDGDVLEGGFQLDEADAPILAFAQYVRRVNDDDFLLEHRAELDFLRDRVYGRFDPATGLFTSLQDSQDEYQKLPFLTYDNVLTWRALHELEWLYARMRDIGAAHDARRRADALRGAILAHCVSTPPGGAGTIFAAATEGRKFVFTDIPPGSLMKLPALGFISENDPLFVRTYAWLHSKAYPYSYADDPYGLPGSHRLPFTTSWSVADHLLLARGHDRALKILLASPWDGGIITEGIDPRTAVMDRQGRAFATAAGYMAHAIYLSSAGRR